MWFGPGYKALETEASPMCGVVWVCFGVCVLLMQVRLHLYLHGG